MQKKKIKLIIRFGLGIIKTNLATPIMSFHHGDPRKYRGRPSGFYEIANKEKIQGQVVQILTPNWMQEKFYLMVRLKFLKNLIKKHFYSYSFSSFILKKALISFKKKIHKS